MNFLFAIYILAGTVIPMEEKQEYYVICFDNNTINTGEFVYFPEGPAKGYNYKKHYRKMQIHRWIDRKIRHNICDQYPN